ncbi:hypothetical protein B0I35DRAFT_160979 [Stachybotrys elegans]|uniref:Uncharacterized protein n=1 Tax=Stachybotrys elegans TaxID=80388 RepID=A0A8K0SX35_9HYPO|nr:hypothetical protein B0I35DRAFT_160979 [Stachybotrys elegans]
MLHFVYQQLHRAKLHMVMVPRFRRPIMLLLALLTWPGVRCTYSVLCTLYWVLCPTPFAGRLWRHYTPPLSFRPSY